MINGETRLYHHSKALPPIHRKDESRDGLNGKTVGTIGYVIQAPSTLGTFLHSFSCGHVRQLDRVGQCHGRTALIGDEHVGMAARMVQEYLGRFGEHPATEQHSAYHNGQGLVGVGFGLVWHENRIKAPRYRVKRTTLVT